MVTRTLPGLGLTGGFTEGDDGWGDAMNANLVKLSALANGGILGRVAAVPAAPVQGDIYILTPDDRVAVFDNGAWVYYAPVEGWMFRDRQTDEFVSFDGTDWVVLKTGGGGLADAPSDGKTYGRKDAAWAEIVASSGGGGGGGGSGGGSPLAFAHVVFDVNYDTKAITLLGSPTNIAKVERLAAGVFKVTFAKAYTGNIGNLNMVGTQRKGPYNDSSDASLRLNRNYNYTGGAASEPGLDLGSVTVRGEDEGRISVSILDAAKATGGGGSGGGGANGHIFAPAKSEMQFANVGGNHSDFPAGTIYKTDAPVPMVIGDRWDFDFVIWHSAAAAREGVGFMNAAGQSFYLKIESQSSPRGYTYNNGQTARGSDGTYGEINFTGPQLVRATVVVAAANQVRVSWGYENGMGWVDGETFDFTGSIYPFVSTTNIAACRIAAGKYAGVANQGGTRLNPWHFNPPKMKNFTDVFGAVPAVATDDPDVGLILSQSSQVKYPTGIGAATTAGSWTLTARFETGMIGGGTRYANAGICVYNAAKNKFLTWTLDSRNVVHLTRFNATGFDNYEAQLPVVSPPKWWRIAFDVATGNAVFSVSNNGKVWVPLITRKITDDLGAAPAFHGLVVSNENYEFVNVLACDYYTFV